MGDGSRKQFSYTTFLAEGVRPITDVQRGVNPYSIKWRNQTTLYPVSSAALNHVTSERENGLAQHKVSLEKPGRSGKVKRGALKYEATERQTELANPKPQRNADAEPLPWQISQKYMGPQKSKRKGVAPNVAFHDCVKDAVNKERNHPGFRARKVPVKRDGGGGQAKKGGRKGVQEDGDATSDEEAGFTSEEEAEQPENKGEGEEGEEGAVAEDETEEGNEAVGAVAADDTEKSEGEEDEEKEGEGDNQGGEQQEEGEEEEDGSRV